MTPFQRRLVNTPGESTLILTGYINESAQFGPFLFSDVLNLNIDFSGVTIINSVGILQWISWIKIVQTNNSNLKIHFSGCPKVIVDQMNSIKGFFPDKASIRSFAAPFRCEPCKKSFTKTFELGKDYTFGTNESDGKFKMDFPVCDSCHKLTSADFLPAKYLKFIQALLKKK